MKISGKTRARLESFGLFVYMMIAMTITILFPVGGLLMIIGIMDKISKE